MPGPSSCCSCLWHSLPAEEVLPWWDPFWFRLVPHGQAVHPGRYPCPRGQCSGPSQDIATGRGEIPLVMLQDASAVGSGPAAQMVELVHLRGGRGDSGRQGGQ